MQAALFEPPRARRSDPATSHQSAGRVREFCHTHNDMILSTLRRFGKAGAEQLAAACKLDAYQTRKRLPEMQRLGLVRATDQVRKTATGRSERIWVAC